MNNPNGVNEFKKYSPVKLEFLTPVSVGNGETLDPMRYTIVKQAKGSFLHLLDIEQWLMDEYDDENLMRMLDSDDYREVRRSVQSNFDPDKNGQENLEKYSLAIIPISSQSTVPNKFDTELKKMDSRNSLLIDSALRSSATYRMLIPGSSIKGAVRTAVIDWLDQNHALKLKKHRDIRHALNDLLGQISENDFRALQINDFELPNDACVLVDSIEQRLNPSKNIQRETRTPKNVREATSGLVFDARQSVFSLSSISLGTLNSVKSLTIKKRQGGSPNAESFDWKRLCQSVTGFYRKRFDEEMEKFYSKPHLTETASLLKPIQDRIDQMNTETDMLLRIGHYSHIESMTLTDVDPDQQVTHRQGKKFYPGTTRTLADGRIPFGWCLLSLSTENDLKDWRSALRQDTKTSGSSTASLLKTDEEKQADAEAEKLRIEEEQKKELLESLSPLDRLIEEMKDNQNYKSEFNKLDEFEGSEQIKLAEFFKKRFMLENQWDVKAKKKKQFQKVQKLKKILGE